MQKENYFNIDLFAGEYCITYIQYFEPKHFWSAGGSNTTILGIFNSLKNAISGIKNNKLYKNQKIIFENKEVF